ncbi:MAG: M90 family metallopeptidase [Acidimicrobiales bacterium]
MAFWRRKAPYLLPDDWEDQVAEVVAGWWDLDVADRTRLSGLMVRLLGEKRWEAARDFELTEQIRLVIAAQACLLLLGLDFEHYRKVRSIIVHPSTQVITGERASHASGLATDEPLPILGQAAHEDGPVSIAWDEAARNARHPERGFNVVFHEFAHKLDMLDGVVDGTPPLEGTVELQRWVDVCTEEFEALREGRGASLLRDYAAVDPGEFFAVVTEVFFAEPRKLQHGRPELYDVLAAFYRQDPAERARLAGR